MSKLSESQIKDATQLRISLAMHHIHKAQDELGRAQQALSALCWGAKEHATAGKLYDRVHDFWYRVQRLKYKPKVRLDQTNIEALERQFPPVTYQG